MSITICYSSTGKETSCVFGSSFNKTSGQQDFKINAIKIFKTGDELSDPIIELGSNETVSLVFDDLSTNTNSYSYSITHCAYNWQESGLIRSEYADGFELNPINDSQNSVATTVPYIHFSLTLPNNDVKIKLSGNYLLRVFDTYNPENILIEQRFMVVEPLLNIKATVKQPLDQELRLTSQQLELVVGNQSINLSNPYTDLIPVISQNSPTDNQQIDLKPTFIRSNEIVYSAPDKLIFDGNNEFRSFDINSIRFLSSGIQSIQQFAGDFNVQLYPALNNRKQKFTVQPDINGKYQVRLERSEMSEIEADYTWVYFTLPYYDQIPDQDVYVYGELTSWKLSSENLMNYNYQRQAYELRLHLKQGYYNYRYVVRDTKTGTVDHAFFEGNHYETENSYLILFYFKQVGKRYDRLVGAKKINSRITI